MNRYLRAGGEQAGRRRLLEGDLRVIVNAFDLATAVVHGDALSDVSAREQKKKERRRVPAALSSRRFCREARRRASSSCFSRACAEPSMGPLECIMHSHHHKQAHNHMRITPYIIYIAHTRSHTSTQAGTQAGTQPHAHAQAHPSARVAIRTFLFAFFPRVLARRARASCNISFSSSSMSTGSGRAGLASGSGSISPGRSLLGSSRAS